MEHGRKRDDVRGSEGEGEDVWEEEELTPDACKQAVEAEEDHRGRKRSAELAGVGEGKRPACSISALPFRFLA